MIKHLWLNLMQESENGLSLHKLPIASLVSVIALNIVFKMLFTPALSEMGPYSLVNHPGVFETLEEALNSNKFSLLLPMDYMRYGREFWWTTSILPLHLIYKIFSPLQVYLLTSSLLIFVAYLCSWKVLHSRFFSWSLALMLALGTQLSYALTYGVLCSYYILLSYITINITIVIYIFQNGNISWRSISVFCTSLIVCLLGHEICLNYAGSLILVLGFLIAWGHKHDFGEVKAISYRLISISTLLIVTYLAIQFATKSVDQYMYQGCEEELIFTHKHIFLMIDDLIINYMTLLYLSLSNYLPTFLFFSNSATYLGEQVIIEGQNGYHESYQHLAYMSYLLSWRFYAGIFSVFFFMFGFKCIKQAWSDKYNIPALVLAALFIAVATGFATHLVIKVRPYNVTPMLTYKAFFSTFAFTLMIAYFGMLLRNNTNNKLFKKLIVVMIFLIPLTSAISRPKAMNAGLTAVGLKGYGDPSAAIFKFISSYFR